MLTDPTGSAPGAMPPMGEPPTISPAPAGVGGAPGGVASGEGTTTGSESSGLSALQAQLAQYQQTIDGLQGQFNELRSVRDKREAQQALERKRIEEELQRSRSALVQLMAQQQAQQQAQAAQPQRQSLDQQAAWWGQQRARTDLTPEQRQRTEQDYATWWYAQQQQQWEAQQLEVQRRYDVERQQLAAIVAPLIKEKAVGEYVRMGIPADALDDSGPEALQSSAFRWLISRATQGTASPAPPPPGVPAPSTPPPATPAPLPAGTPAPDRVTGHTPGQGGTPTVLDQWPKMSQDEKERLIQAAKDGTMREIR